MPNITPKVVAAYEAMAERYNDLIDHKPHNAYYDRPNTLALLPDVAGKRILDAACGPGKYAEILLANGAIVTGFDISPKMVEYAQKRNSGKGHFFVHDFSHPLDNQDDATFDIVLCALAMDYLEDWAPTLLEFARILKPGGALVISMEHPFFKYEEHQSKKYFETEHVSMNWRGFGNVEVHSYRRSLGAVLASITDNGFFIDRVVEPKPTAEFEARDPKHFKELNEFPGFLCVRGIKR